MRNTPHQPHEGESRHERAERIAKEGHHAVLIIERPRIAHAAVVLKADSAHHIHEQGWEAVNKERIGTKRLEENTQTLLSAYVNNPNQERKQQRCQAASHEYVTGRPHGLIDGKSIVEQEARHEDNRPHDKQAINLIPQGLAIENQLTGIRANQHMRKARDGRE